MWVEVTHLMRVGASLVDALFSVKSGKLIIQS